MTDLRLHRRAVLRGAAVGLAGVSAPALDAIGAPADGFKRYLAGLWPDAERAGVSRAVFERAIRDLLFDPSVVALASKQGEFNRPIAEYVETAASPARVSRGRDLLGRHVGALASATARTGVPGAILVAIWGMESEYGRGTGSRDIVRSLASLASAGHREPFFRGETVAALRILQSERLDRQALTGSWAGAMGQPQFMPTTFLKHATDGDGDGRCDIWGSAADTLASIATLLAAEGWRRDLPWGEEVTVPDGLDLRLHRRDRSEWRAMGLRDTAGRPVAGTGPSQLVFFAGRTGPAFLFGENWEAIRGYNTSDSYALAVGRLADRIAGDGALSRPWPKLPALTGDERREIHRSLAARGVYAGTPDGKFGAATRDAVRRFQIEAGLLPDGFAGRDVLAALRKGG